MAGCTRKGGKKHAGGRWLPGGGRKRTTTRRTKHKHTKTCKHARRGGKKSGHKKRKQTRRGRKMRGGHAPNQAESTVLTITGNAPGSGGSPHPSENAWVSVAKNTGIGINRAAHVVAGGVATAVSKVSGGLSQAGHDLNPWHW